jgi:hypothetical protein
VNRKLTFLEFLYKNVEEGALIFIKQYKDEIEIQKTVSTERT